MADLKEIRGLNIPARASDPSNPVAGEIWYNTTSNTTKGRVYYNGVWGTGGICNNKYAYATGFGSSNSDAVQGSGFIQDVGGNKNGSESYDGTSWTSNPNMNQTLRVRVGAGHTSTAGIIAGGMSTTNSQSSSEEWNGSSWSNTPSLNNAKDSGGMAGTASSAGYTGGEYFPPGGAGAEGPADQFEEWNGSSWSNSTAMPYKSVGQVGAGASSSSLIAQGGLRYSPPTNTNITSTLEWNGSAWSLGGTAASSHRYGAGIGQSVSAALAVAGSPGTPSSAGTEIYDGTSWTSGNDVSNGRYAIGGAGTSTSALIYNGTNNDVTSPFLNGYTEEYQFGGATLTVSSS